MRQHLDTEIYAQFALWIGRFGMAFFTLMATAHFAFGAPIREGKYGPPMSELKAVVVVALGFSFFAGWAWFGKKLLAAGEDRTALLAFIVWRLGLVGFPVMAVWLLLKLIRP